MRRHRRYHKRIGLRLLLAGLTFTVVFTISQASIPHAYGDTSSATQQQNTLTNDQIPPAAVINLTAENTFSPILPPCGNIVLYPMVETIGVTMPNPPAAADHATIRYRKNTATTWIPGHDAVITNSNQIVGSIFWLSPATTYDVEITTRATNDDPLLISQCSATTQADTPITTSSRAIYVSATAGANPNGTLANPFPTIQAAVNMAVAGDTIHVQAGVYHESVRTTNSGTAGSFIKIIGDPGAILDASDATIEQNGLTWIPDGSHSNVYSATLPGNFPHLNSLLSEPIWRDSQHFYTYDSLAGLQSGTGHNAAVIDEGWYFDPGSATLYVRSLTNPQNYTWHIPSVDFGFILTRSQYIWIEGFTFHHYPLAVYFHSASHSIARNNSIQAKTGFLVDNSGGVEPDDNRIESNTLSDAPVADWGYDAVKGTVMETGAIVIGQGTGTIVHDNRIEQYHDGIVYSGTAETDVYRNIIRNLSDDGLEPDGPAINYRAWGNIVDNVLSSMSLAPIDTGPAWILYNRFTQFSGRGLKIGDGVTGIGYIYHNTLWTNKPSAAATQQVSTDTNSYILRNNILDTEDAAGPAIRWTINMPGINMDYDNAYSSTPAPYYWTPNIYTSLTQVCIDKKAECHGSQVLPMFSDPTHGKFDLVAGSPNLDSAIRIPGINDVYSGPAPDRGYIEFGQSELHW